MSKTKSRKIASHQRQPANEHKTIVESDDKHYDPTEEDSEAEEERKRPWTRFIK